MGELRRIKGIGPVMETRLNAHGIQTLTDVVKTVPFRYEIHRIGTLSNSQPGDPVVLSGRVEKNASVAYIRRRLTKTTFDFRCGDQVLKVGIFNREFLRSSLIEGAEAVVTGRLEPDGTRFVASDVQLRKNYREGILPVYRIPDIGDSAFSKWVREAYEEIRGEILDDIPDVLLKKNQISPLREFFEIVHQPRNETDIEAATLRIKYEELLRFGIKIACMRRLNDQIETEPKHYDIELVRKFIASLPYELTPDQKQATNEIFTDLKRPHQMMRLLQGDVGSGKTVVAAIATLAVVSGGEQVALMAPTEILARQNYETFSEWLAPFGVKTAFLSASVKGWERERILAGLANGTIDLLAGTHSLIQEPIRFRKLGFAVIDEQHRFGVRQRKILREKGMTPDMLFLSATPIPRTLAIALFGDMDVSSIRALPAGRKKILTKVVDYSDFDSVIRQLVSQLDQGHQAYVIVPLIQESERSEFADVSSALTEVKNRVPSRYSVAGLHGKMPAEEKNRILGDFASGKTSVLVSTTVVEVGVNVPNATCMVILDCERFGLSQLHQLRGRVGRSSDQAYCFLVTDSIVEGENRFAILESTTDGFAISEEDLRQRGPGEVFGEEQTGIPKFRMANLISDQELLQTAFADAESLFTSQDPLSRSLIRKTFLEIGETNLD